MAARRSVEVLLEATQARAVERLADVERGHGGDETRRIRRGYLQSGLHAPPRLNEAGGGRQQPIELLLLVLLLYFEGEARADDAARQCPKRHTHYAQTGGDHLAEECARRAVTFEQLAFSNNKIKLKETL